MTAELAPTPLVESAPAIQVPDPEEKPVTKRKPNPQGKVFVVEYHHIGKGEDAYFRTPELFRGDLERLYKMGFRPCTASDYLAGRFDMAPGATPVIITFDDSNEDQFRLLPDGSVDPKCGIGVWQAFAAKHPDFPVKGTFFVLPNFFGQPKWQKKKFEILQSLGSEVASHTYHHGELRKLTDQKVKEELAQSFDWLKSSFGLQNPYMLCLPYGELPRNKSLLHGFRLDGRKYHLSAVFLVGAEPSPVPGSPRFNRLRIPRIQARTGPYGLDFWLDLVERKRVTLYVTGE